MNQLIAYIDGGSRGNPGPAAAAFILIEAGGARLSARACLLGRTTNNVAEYTALQKALEAARQSDARRITVFSDSELLVKQVSGEYKVKRDKIRPLFGQARNLLDHFESLKVRFIPTEQNSE